MQWIRIYILSLHLYPTAIQLSDFLGKLHPSWQSERGVVLDFTQCTFLSAEGAAVLAALSLQRQSQGRRTLIDWSTVPFPVSRQLGRWRLSELFESSNHPWTDSAIPLFHQPVLDVASLIRYISTQVQTGGNMPAMSPELAKRVQHAFCELFQNIFLHADSPCGGLTIGQFYPNAKEVQICVCDPGVGLVNRVQQAGYGLEAPEDAILWSLKEGTTTRKPGGDPGGLGLYLLQNFVKVNGGGFRMLANTGYYSLNRNTQLAQTLTSEFPGTLIQVRLLIQENVLYTIKPD
jgi:anti-sigma regulatory factor (Ser/Thr protein kinase)